MTLPQERVINVMVVDDQPSFRKATAIVIKSMPGVQLIGEAHDLASALQLTTTHGHADVAIVDLHLGPEDGSDVCRQLRANCPDLEAVLVSTTDVEDLPADVHTCGAIGFIPKSRFGIDTLDQILELAGHLR